MIGGGKFISFEGGEGTGKTTQITRLAERLEARGFAVLAPREPGGTPLGEELRHLRQHAEAGRGMCAEAELLLFAASRAELVRKVIGPARAAGKIVLADRFFDSTTVYQGAARHLPREAVHAVNAFAVGGVMPDLTIVFDLPAETGRERVLARENHTLDRLDAEKLDFYREVRAGYQRLSVEEPTRVVLLEANRQPDAIEADITEVLRQRLGL